MLTRFISKNFKCLSSVDEQLAPLTLLTGFNAAGKSSLVQAIGLLRQTAIESEWGTELKLNGQSVQLGTMFDAIDRNAGGEGFSLGIGVSTAECVWTVAAEERTKRLEAPITKIVMTKAGVTREWEGSDLRTTRLHRLVPEGLADADLEMFTAIHNALTNIVYLGAERIGPREVYLAQSSQDRPDVGTRGELTPWCLEQFAEEPANLGVKLEGVTPTVKLTVRAWMDRLFPGSDYQIRRVDGANLISMSIRTTPRGDYFRPTNVGFGLTHVLPVLVAGITARPGDVLVIENPETHLHPAGQSDIGYFLALASSAGTQVILETHSDHVLNGIRRAVKDGALSQANVKILFFSSDIGDDRQAHTNINHIAIEEGGRVSDWPDGFFDQFESDLDALFGNR